MILEKTFPAMGTVHTITLFDAEGPHAANDARAYLQSLNQAWSCFQAGSLISRINALRPDLVLFGGDYATDHQSALNFFKVCS